MPTLRTILAATDLTDASDDVLRAAAGLARRTGAALHVIHSFDFPPAPYFDVAPDPHTFQARIDDAEAAFDEQIARTIPPDVAVAGLRLEIFAAARAIADWAAAIHADLVVLGPHTRRRFEAGFLGTTADRVIRTVDVPVLIVRGELRLPPRNVLVPVDLADHTDRVVDAAVDWTRALADGTKGTVEMEIAHVAPRILAPRADATNRAGEDPGIARLLKAAAKRAGNAPSVRATEEVLWGDRPEREIACHAREAGTDLVIMATHGYGIVRRALIGSVAGGVARSAHCPVLLLPPAVWTVEPVVAAVTARTATG